MSEITTIGLDIAKQIFHVVGCDARGVEVSRRRLRRGQVMKYFVQLAPCRVGIEACASAHHWGRELSALGHAVELLPPRAVKAPARTPPSSSPARASSPATDSASRSQEGAGSMTAMARPIFASSRV